MSSASVISEVLSRFGSNSGPGAAQSAWAAGTKTAITTVGVLAAAAATASAWYAARSGQSTAPQSWVPLPLRGWSDPTRNTKCGPRTRYGSVSESPWRPLSPTVASAVANLTAASSAVSSAPEVSTATAPSRLQYAGPYTGRSVAGNQNGGQPWTAEDLSRFGPSNQPFPSIVHAGHAGPAAKAPSGATGSTSVSQWLDAPSVPASSATGGRWGGWGPQRLLGVRA